MSESSTERVVQLFFGILGAAAAIVFVQYFFEFSFALLDEVSPEDLTSSSAIILTTSFVFAWLSPRLWRLDWVLSLLLAISGLSALFVFFAAVIFRGGSSGLLMFAVALGLCVASATPWFTLRKVIKGRAGRSDGKGHIEFLDGGHGRTELRSEGDVVAWLERSSDTSGYREDGDATRYRAISGTREELVAHSRRRAALMVLVGLSISACFVAVQSMSVFRFAYL